MTSQESCESEKPHPLVQNQSDTRLPLQEVILEERKMTDSTDASIPVLPMGVAISLCVVNCLFPGLGTIIASFTIFCCAIVPEGHDKFNVFCINFLIGWAQLITVPVLFAGWIWSITWGVRFVSIAAKSGNVEELVVTSVTTLPSKNARQTSVVSKN
ncbi:protein SPEC3-like isoform X2 [Clavelina lepadiformis]|uniref:protein SPEC3-like isoform X2 n=1 Tax=Clavelina lepadiformis TaxID=159417 RepID=UPI004042B5E3